MSALEIWLKQATRRLSAQSIAQVRTEIQEHYESAREAAMSGGATAEEADYAAVASLGDAKTANRQYRNVLLTAAEAKMLRDVKREANILCSQWGLRLAPLAPLAIAAASLTAGLSTIAHVMFLVGVAMGILIAAPTLPIYTPLRARLYRYLKWPVMIVAVWLTVDSSTLTYWWGAFSIVSIGLIWTEWTRMSIRRKLPKAEWPKSLYL